MEERLREWVKSNDPKVRDRMMRNAELVADRGLDAVLCLVARGVGETTAIKIKKYTYIISFFQILKFVIMIIINKLF